MRMRTLRNPQIADRRGYYPARDVHDHGQSDPLEFTGHEHLASTFKKALAQGTGEVIEQTEDAGASARRDTEQFLRDGLDETVVQFPCREG